MVAVAPAAGAATVGAGARSAAVTAPGAPTGLTAVSGDASVSLSWSAPSTNGGASIEGYNVYVSTSPGQENLATPDNGALLVQGTSFTVSVYPDGSSLSDGIPYYFVVTAVNAGGQESPASNEASSTPTAEIPAAPTGVTAVAGPQDHAATITWNPSVEPNGSPASSYNVTATDNTAHTTSTTECQDITPSAGLSCNWTGLTDGDSYTFTVVAYNSLGQPGPASAPSNAVVPGPQVADISGANLRALYGNGTADLVFQSADTVAVPPAQCASGYTTNGACLLGYNVYMSTTPGGEGTTPINGVFPLAGTQLSLDRTAVNIPPGVLTNGTTYYFTVAIVNAMGVSAQSNETSVTPANTNPGPPTGVTATAGPESITLNWTAPASNGGFPIYEYEIWRCTGAANQCTGDAITNPLWTRIGNTGGSPTTSFTDTDVVYGDTYWYYVVTETMNDANRGGSHNYLNALGESPYSAPSATVSASTTGVAPSAPVLSVDSNATTGEFDLSWSAPSYIGASPTWTPYVFIDGTAANATDGGSCYGMVAFSTGCTTAALTTGPTNVHSFYVIFVNGVSASSGQSNLVSAYWDQLAPSAPTGLSAVGEDTGDNGAVSLSWNPSGYVGPFGSTIDYSVSIATSAAGPFTPDAHCNPGVSTSEFCTLDASNNPLVIGTTYFFYVQAENGSNVSGQSNLASATPIDNDDFPYFTGNGTLTSPAQTASTITLSWPAASADPGSLPILGYSVFRRMDTPYGYGRYHIINTSMVTGTSFVATGLPPEQTFEFKVCAYNANTTWFDGTCISAYFSTTLEQPPNQPGNVQVVTNGSVFSNSWNAPTFTGGGVIVGYFLVATLNTSCLPFVSIYDVLNAPATFAIGSQALAISLYEGENLLSSTSAIGDYTKLQQTLSYLSLQLTHLNVDCTITSYDVNVVAVDFYPAVGNVDISLGTGTPVSGQVGAFLPDAPSTVSASPAGGGGAFVAWSTPSGNGAPITGYVVTPVVNGHAGTPMNEPASASNATFHGLKPGANVYFTVAAMNSVGTGAMGQSNTVTIPKYISHMTFRTNRRYVRYGHEGAVVLSVTVKGYRGPATGIVRIPGACIIHLRGGKGSCRLGKVTLLPGVHHLRAHYQGSVIYNVSGSGTVTVIVTKK